MVQFLNRAAGVKPVAGGYGVHSKTGILGRPGVALNPLETLTGVRGAFGWKVMTTAVLEFGMCECTPSMKVRYCGRPGCRDPQTVEQERINRDAEESARRRAEAGDFEQQRQQRDDFGDVPQ